MSRLRAAYERAAIRVARAKRAYDIAPTDKRWEVLQLAIASRHAAGRRLDRAS